MVWRQGAAVVSESMISLGLPAMLVVLEHWTAASGALSAIAAKVVVEVRQLQ